MRSLYDCIHAKVRNKVIFCHYGFLDEIDNAAIGKPLINPRCKQCRDFEPFEEPLPKSERGWIKKGTQIPEGVSK